MSLSVNYVSKATVVETLEGGMISANDNTVTTTGMNVDATLTASTTPAVTKYSAGTATMSGGAVTIDLTSLPDTNGTAGAVTLTGMKLAVAKFRNKSTNANEITIAKGASNGHTGFGSAFSITLQPGDEVMFKFNDNSGNVAVGGTDKTIDISGTGSQVCEYEFVA